jgi:hypothetical protein
MAGDSYPEDWKQKYTDPDLRARLKDEVVAADKGGKPGQWSARKAQLLKAAYEKAGGAYLGDKDATQQHLSQWSSEDWQTSDGSPSARTGSTDERGGASKRYLPKEAWDELSEEDKAATNAAKAEGSADGEQFVANPEAAAEAGRRARDHADDSVELPVNDYDDLDARQAAKAVNRLVDRDEVLAVRDHEQAHRDRKTVLERVDRKLAD